MPLQGLPAILEMMDEDTKEVRRISLSVRRQELRWDYIRRLDPESAGVLIWRVVEAKKELKVLPRRLRASLEAGILRGIVAMAENDLREILHIQADPMSQGFLRKKRVKRSERARGRGRGGYL